MKVRMQRWSVLAGTVLALSMVGAPALAADPSADDPVATVNTLLDTLAAKDFAGIAPLVCEQFREEVATRFDLGAAFEGMPEGVDVAALINGLILTIDPREVTLVSSDAATASVDIVATLNISVDETAAREFVKQLIESQGQEATDAVVDMVMPDLMAQFGEGQDLSETTTLTFENGAWVVCEPFGSEDPTASPGASGDPLASPMASPAASPAA